MPSRAGAHGDRGAFAALAPRALQRHDDPTFAQHGIRGQPATHRGLPSREGGRRADRGSWSPVGQPARQQTRRRRRRRGHGGGTGRPGRGARAPYLSAVVFPAALQLYDRARRPVHHRQAQVHMFHRLLLRQGPFLERKTAGQGRATRGPVRGRRGPQRERVMLRSRDVEPPGPTQGPHATFRLRAGLQLGVSGGASRRSTKVFADRRGSRAPRTPGTKISSINCVGPRRTSEHHGHLLPLNASWRHRGSCVVPTRRTVQGQLFHPRRFWEGSAPPAGVVWKQPLRMRIVTCENYKLHRAYLGKTYSV